MRNVKTYEEIQAAEAQIWEKKASIDYTSVEFPVETLVEKYLNDDFSFSENLTVAEWNKAQQSKFIETILLNNMPIPNLLFIKQGEGDTDKYEILDGIERVKTLVAFLTGELKLESLKKINSLNGFYFRDLPQSIQRKIRRKSMRTVKLWGDFSKENKKDFLDRINLMQDNVVPITL